MPGTQNIPVNVVILCAGEPVLSAGDCKGDREGTQEKNTKSGIDLPSKNTVIIVFILSISFCLPGTSGRGLFPPFSVGKLGI